MQLASMMEIVEGMAEGAGVFINGVPLYAVIEDEDGNVQLYTEEGYPK